MSGALSERVFVKKLQNVGFSDIEVVQRHPFGLDDASQYPLFTPDLIELMEDLLSAAQKSEVATSITLVAQKPA